MAQRQGGNGIALGVIASAALVLLLATPGRRGAPRPQQEGDDRPADSMDHAPAIRSPGLWGILKSVVSDVSDNRLLTEAAGVTFYALLALFPALAAMVSLYGLYADPATVSDHLRALSGVVPGGGMEIIDAQVRRLSSNGAGRLGFGLVVGLATSLWSSNQAIKALFDSLNTVFREREQRSFLWRTLQTLGFTLGTILFVLVAMSLIVVLPVALDFIGFGPFSNILVRLARWPAMLLGAAVFLAFVYRFGPCRESVAWRWVSWGSAIASVIWLAGSAAFSWYVAHFGSYNQTYGSLGAVIGFMTWIWLSAFVVLAGAQLDAEMETRAGPSEKTPVSKHHAEALA
jgi:membrane protein